MSLFLVGARGSGKTSAGRLAAQQLGVPFVDTDQVVAERAGKSIAQIFSEEGESAFRALERDILLQLLAKRGELVATGGGCVLDPDVREGLRACGRTLWLTAEPDVLGQRIQGSSRPSLTGAKPEEEVAAILAQRAPLYQMCAAERILTGGVPLQEVADVIKQFWSSLPYHDLR